MLHIETYCGAASQLEAFACSHGLVSGAAGVTVAPPGALLADVLRVFLGESRESLVFDRITVEVGTMNGRPCIRGLRFTVAHLLRLVAVGWTLEQIQGEFPFIEAEDIQQALLYAAHSAEVTALSSHGIG